MYERFKIRGANLATIPYLIGAGFSPHLAEQILLFLFFHTFTRSRTLKKVKSIQ